MKDKSKEQLINELVKMRQRIAELEELETEHKRMEEELRESNKRFRDIVENALEWIWEVDANGKYTYVSHVVEKILGYKPEEILEKHFYDLFYPEDREKLKKVAFKVFAKKQSFSEFKNRNMHKNGKTVWLSTSGVPILDEKGTLLGYRGADIDITECKRAEEELKSSSEQLRNLYAHLESVREEERTHIAREIHDELGQALTALKMDLSWLNHKLPKDQKSLLEKTKSILKLIDNIIRTVQRISTELRPGILDDLGLAAAIEWQVEEFQKRSGIKCKVNLVPEDVILAQDCSTTIFRIFQETLTNVARHANATRVKVSLKEKVGKLELKVKDNGKGITEKQISDSKSLGLIGIRERVHFWGGEVKISGIQDKGTTITVSIPLNKKGVTR
ncbi:PAS domain S-box protein [candidate division WOR-3 bacterium]|nr:PAS domain S-box protein [candidate division WOR-3 bacterium]